MHAANTLLTWDESILELINIGVALNACYYCSSYLYGVNSVTY